jgi:hypothetical protein
MDHIFVINVIFQSTTAEFVGDVRTEKFNVSYPSPIASKDILVFITLGIPSCRVKLDVTCRPFVCAPGDQEKSNQGKRGRGFVGVM